MQILKRLVVIIIGLLLFAFITVIFLLPDALVALAANIQTISPAARIIAAIIIDAILLALVYTQIRPTPKPVETGLAVRASGAVTDVNIDSARERILKAVRAVPDVLSTNAILEAVRGKASVNLEVVVNGAQVNVPNKQKEINRALRQVIEKQLGLQMASRPRVHIILQEEISIPPAIATSSQPGQTTFPPTTRTPVTPSNEAIASIEKETSRPFTGFFGGRHETVDDLSVPGSMLPSKSSWADTKTEIDPAKTSNDDEKIVDEQEDTISTDDKGENNS